MADAVDTINVSLGPHRIVKRFTNISDGTGEADVVKFDASATVGPVNGFAPVSFTVEEVFWNIQGFTSVRIEWDANTDDECLVLSGSGYLNLTEVGGLKDPRSTGFTGDVLFTTAGATSGATYTIVMVVRPEPA